MTYVSLTHMAQERIAQQLQPGQFAIDATVGNGHDTVFLAESVGTQGQVIGFDIQSQALANTHQRMADAEFESHVTLIHDGHENMSAQVPASMHGQISAIMFNLGYLPGSDKHTITLPKTTSTAIKAATRLLAPNGVMTILVYRGHAGGQDEADAVIHVLESLCTSDFEISRHTSPGPWLYVIEKRK